MKIATTIKEVRKQVADWKREGLTVGLVPTMGALHEGHASLVDAAKEQCDRVVTSVFVNPTQFAAGEDLDAYPRDFDRDCGILEAHGCDLVFHPGVEEMYPEGAATFVELRSDMTKQLCGKSRPEHFCGVCTVVSKLFHIAMPDKAFFGDQHVLLKHRQRGLIPHGEIHSLAFERKPGFPPGLKPSGKQADIRIAFALQFFSGNGTIQRASSSVYQERRGHIRHQSPHLLLKSRFEDADAG